MNLKENKDKKSMRAILQDVSRVTGVSKVLILSRVRKQEVADARMLFCHMARKEGYLLREIASFIGKSYSRVSMACCDVVLRKEMFRPLLDRLSGCVKASPDNQTTMEPEDYIEELSFVVVNPDYPVVGKSVVLKALRMERDRTVTKAVEILSSVLDNWVHGGDADCIIAEFEEKLGEALKKKQLKTR